MNENYNFLIWDVLFHLFRFFFAELKTLKNFPTLSAIFNVIPMPGS